MNCYSLVAEGLYGGNKPHQVASLIFLSNPKKELPSINHLPNGNDRIIPPGGVNPEDRTNHTSLSRAIGRKLRAIAAWEDLRLPTDLSHLSSSEVTPKVANASHCFHIEREQNPP